MVRLSPTLQRTVGISNCLYSTKLWMDLLWRRQRARPAIAPQEQTVEWRGRGSDPESRDTVESQSRCPGGRGGCFSAAQAPGPSLCCFASFPGQKFSWGSLWSGAAPGVLLRASLLLKHGFMRCTRLSDFTFTFHFHALEEEMATHSRILVWRIPGTGEPGGLPSMGSYRVRHDWSDLAAAATAWDGRLCKEGVSRRAPTGEMASSL